MRIYLKPTVILVVVLGVVCLLWTGTWIWWRQHRQPVTSFTYPTPKSNLNDLEQAILMDNRFVSTCQHFAQGKQLLVVDSKGYLCQRRHLDKTNGCCQTISSSILGPYICDNCTLSTYCCNSFEHCISCCLKPEHRIHLQHYIRSRDLKTKLLLSHLSTPFDVCLSRCRTHSHIIKTMIDSDCTNEEEKQIERIPRYLPFRIQWLDSCYQQTCLPDSPWHRILDELEPALSNRVRQQFNNSQRRQMLIELLGAQFQKKFFRTELDNSSILNVSAMTKEQRCKLENEAKSWLQIQTLKAASEIGAAKKDIDETTQSSAEMAEFLEYTNQVVWKGLERYLYQIQQKEFQEHETQKLHEMNQIKRYSELTGGSKLRFILRDSRTNSRKLPMIHESPSTVHPMTSQYSNLISESIIALLKQDLRRITFLKEKLFGQQLPVALRQISWTECLFRFEKKPHESDLSFVELKTRRDFASGITRGKNELKLSNPLNTPMKNLIENDVIETYGKIRALQPYLEEYHLRFTIKILNVLYTYKKSYEIYYIYWLLPFQLTYCDEENKDEKIYVIGMHLDLFIRHCFPTWPEIYTIASKIISDISINDSGFYNHLKKISRLNAKINVKDFPMEILSLNDKQTKWKKVYDQELMTDPVIFLRKWICEMFVGILNSNSVLYLWDQFFMVKWELNYIEHACRAIVYLLRDKFMCAENYEEMRRVFLDEPCLLYTSDIQTAFVHLALKQDDPKYIPAMNQRIRPMKSLDNIEIRSNKQTIYLESVGIEHISLTLITPFTKDPRREVHCKSITVQIDIYGGGEKLGSTTTKSAPKIRKRERYKPSWERLFIDMTDEKLILPAQQTRQSLIPIRIQALITVYEQIDPYTKPILGHCRFPLYIPQKIGNLDTWDVTCGPVQRALHAGLPPSSIDMIPDTPKTSASDRIGSATLIYSVCNCR
ncbi:unnamed protein product [Adineta ricciae]|uniref:SREBP regulating gene protein n=1 Tax=Adineta ricciae TaxID=249248 RepID=A0A814M7L4_ADIRI|nr:unnamed protein product [Adineta ricciae]